MFILHEEENILKQDEELTAAPARNKKNSL